MFRTPSQVTDISAALSDFTIWGNTGPTNEDGLPTFAWSNYSVCDRSDEKGKGYFWNFGMVSLLHPHLPSLP